MSFDLFDPARAGEVPADIADGLEVSREERGAFGSPLFYLPVIGSTNDASARLADAGAGEGTTVVAEAQTAGRGRHGRAWCSPPGAGLYVSTVFRPDKAGERGALPSLLTLMSGVALADAVRETTGMDVEIKWPNDLVIGRRKLAGILAEASALGSALEYVVLGFGINIHAAAYPPEVAARATSLEEELGRGVDRARLLARALVNLARCRAALAGGRVSEVLDRWRARAPSAVGAPIEWVIGGAARRGRTAGLGDDGALLVEVDGAVERVVAGEITWL